MSIGADSPALTPPHVDNYVTSSTAPYQASPTNSNASYLPLTQVLGGNTDHTYTASTVDHELNVVTMPNPSGTSTGQTIGNNAQPDSLAHALGESEPRPDSSHCSMRRSPTKRSSGIPMPPI